MIKRCLIFTFLYLKVHFLEHSMQNNTIIQEVFSLRNVFRTFEPAVIGVLQTVLSCVWLHQRSNMSVESCQQPDPAGVLWWFAWLEQNLSLWSRRNRGTKTTPHISQQCPLFISFHPSNNLIYCVHLTITAVIAVTCAADLNTIQISLWSTGKWRLGQFTWSSGRNEHPQIVA